MDDDLHETLEGLCAEAIGGDAPGPLLAARLERVVRAELLRRGLGAAVVQAISDRRGTAVRVRLPADPRARVREIVVRVG